MLRVSSGVHGVSRCSGCLQVGGLGLLQQLQGWVGVTVPRDWITGTGMYSTTQYLASRLSALLTSILSRRSETKSWKTMGSMFLHSCIRMNQSPNLASGRDVDVEEGRG